MGSGQNPSLITKIVSGICATIVAPILVAMGVKFVGADGSSVPSDPASQLASGQATRNGPLAPQVMPIGQWSFVSFVPTQRQVNPFEIESDGLIRCSAKGSRGALVLPGQYADFKLTFECRWADERSVATKEGGGIIVRSSTTQWPDNALQIDLTPNRLGALQPGKNITLKSVKQGAVQVQKPSAWQRMEIVCRGGHLTVKQNDAVVSECTNLSRKLGRVGLLAEGGKVEFRGLQLEELHPAHHRRKHPARPASKHASGGQSTRDGTGLHATSAAVRGN